jgi:hypothetical protein
MVALGAPFDATVVPLVPTQPTIEADLSAVHQSALRGPRRTRENNL